MRRLAVMTAVLAMAGAAMAEDRPGSTTQEARETGQAATRDTKEGAQQAGEKMQATGQQAREDASQTGAEAQQSGQQAMDKTREQLKKDSFDVSGTVEKASATELTLHRKDAPPATLHVGKETRIELDGKKVAVNQLQPGQEVRASFNLEGDKPMAIEIKAKAKK